MAGGGEGNTNRTEPTKGKGTERAEQERSGGYGDDGPSFVLAVVSLVSIGVCISPWAGLLTQSGAMSVLAVAMGSGLLIAAVSIEEALTVRNYIRSDVAKYAIGLLVALAAYMCRRTTLDEVNAVFHIDPGPLPMTVWAGTALNLAKGRLRRSWRSGKPNTRSSRGLRPRMPPRLAKSLRRRGLCLNEMELQWPPMLMAWRFISTSTREAACR